MNMKMPDFNVKKLVKDAGTTLSRVVQLTEEKLGTAERTELDSHFENLAERAESTRTWTEKIVRDTETVLIPNPGNRVEDFIFEKIEKQKPTRLSNLESLGLSMIEAGGDFGQDGAYGMALIKVGQAEQKLGLRERDFIATTGICFTQPLKKFLDGEMKTIIKEKGILETKRLDLDACKNRVRKARTMIGQPAAERDLRVAQAEFDRQSEITKLLLEGISTSQGSHLRHLHSFVETQAKYYAQCLQVMNDLQRDLANMRPQTPRLRINSEDVDNDGPPIVQTNENINIGFNQTELENLKNLIFNEKNPKSLTFTSFSLGGPTPYIPVGLDNNKMGDDIKNRSPDGGNFEQSKRARVLCSYDAKDHTELNLNANEVIFVNECSPTNSDYMYGKQGLMKGLVPRAFLEILDDDQD